MANPRSPLLSVRSLSVDGPGRPDILSAVSFTLPANTITALMGPNGSGKSTLAATLAGHPDYTVTGGSVRLGGKNLLSLEPHQRAAAGLSIAWQHPRELPGVRLGELLFTSYQAVRGKAASHAEFDTRLAAAQKLLKLPKSFLERSVNDGLSGGEKKRTEVLQLLVLQPTVAVFDEIDSGLDIDALRTIARAIATLKTKTSAVLVITHYQRLLRYLPPQHVHVLVNGHLAQSGGPALAKKLETRGYGWLGGATAK